MKTSVLFLIIVVIVFGLYFDVKAQDNPLIMDTRTAISLRAAELATQDMQGLYSWSEYRTCSSYVSQYLRHLAFPVDGMQGQFADHPDPFPWSGVMYQTDWLRRNYPQEVHDAPLLDFLNGKLWDRIAPGSVVYLQTSLNHNGYNTYYHSVVLVGYHEDGSPQFAEISPGIVASSDRTFEQMTRNYRGKNGWLVEPFPNGKNTPDNLIVTWFDPLAVLHQGSLWLNPGPVVPSGQAVRNFDEVVTVNLYDGTTSFFRKVTTNGAVTWQPIELDGRTEFYAVTGRQLPANKKIASAFLQKRPTEIYDSDFGVYISNFGVYQHTWTPQMMARLNTFAYIRGFGGLNGSTDTSVLRPQVYDKWGKLVDYYVNSSFTIHRVPDVTQQDILLRTDLLIKANRIDHSPIPVPKGYLSSGCVNYDTATWKVMKDHLTQGLSDGKEIAVIFSYPDFDLDLLPNLDLMNAPFTVGPFDTWCPESGGTCDRVDRRYYRQTYLD